MHANELSSEDRHLIALYAYSLLALVSTGKWDAARAASDLISKFTLFARQDGVWRVRMRAVAQLAD